LWGGGATIERDVARGYDDDQIGRWGLLFATSLRSSVGQVKLAEWSERNGQPGDAGPSVMDGFHWDGYAIGTN